MRKGQSTFMVQTIPRILFLVVVMFAMVFLVRKYVVDNLNVQEVQAEVVIDRILYSPNGILYADGDTGASIPGIIDTGRITSDILNKLMNYSDSSFASGRVDVVNISNGATVASAFYNKETYDKWLPIAETGLKGPGGYRKFTRSIAVTYVVQSGKHVPGLLYVEVLLPGN